MSQTNSHSQPDPQRRYALISVSDKTGIDSLAESFVRHHITILASDGTYAYLRNLPLFSEPEYASSVMRISDYTQMDEMLSSRLKTIHPKIHGGILADRSNPSHIDDIHKHHMKLIDYVVVNFYPFQQQISQIESQSHSLSHEQLMLSVQEFIDIGGPCMLRAAAKNWPYVSACSQISHYQIIRDHLESHTELSLNTKRFLACCAFQLTSELDTLIWHTLSDTAPEDDLIHYLKMNHQPSVSLPYGENAHQKAQWVGRRPKAFLGDIHQHQGKLLSYNNYLDAHMLTKIILEFCPHHVSVVIKHGNPCGFAYAPTAQESLLQDALCGDTLSAYGGVIGTTMQVHAAHAEVLVSRFYEVIMAPSFTAKSLDIFKQKPNLRVIEAPWIANHPHSSSLLSQEIRSVAGGFLIQDSDSPESLCKDTSLTENCVLHSSDLLDFQSFCHDARISFQLVKYLKSNAICIVNQGQMLAGGSGFTSRIEAAEFALSKAQKQHLDKLPQATLASDGFFPFRDVIDLAAAYKIGCVIAPSGSIRDSDSIQAASDHNIHLVLAPKRHFLH